MTQALLDAIKAGDLARVKDLLKRNPSLADARSNGGAPAAVFALYYGHKDVSDVIVAAGATLDLPAAAAVGRLDLVKSISRRIRSLSTPSPETGTPPSGSPRTSATPTSWPSSSRRERV